jgi:hypothetical protein
MGKVVDFKSAHNKKELERKDARVKQLKTSFQSAREAKLSKSKSAEKLKKLFRSSNPKSPFPKNR